MTQPERPQTDWDKRQRLHGFGYAEGSYYCSCGVCGRTFEGAKRSCRCEGCATAAADEWDALTPEQQRARRAANSKIVEQWWADRDKAARRSVESTPHAD